MRSAIPESAWPRDESQQRRQRVLVVGDLMLDRMVTGSAERTSPEAPVLVLHAIQTEHRPGGAAAVAELIRGLKLESEVQLAGVVGADREGQQLRELLQAARIDVDAVIVDESRPTTVKERFVGRAAGRHAQQVLRVDYEATHDLSPRLVADLWQRIVAALPDVNAVLVSDYAKGVCTTGLMELLVNECQSRGVPLLVDPARRDDVSRYSGASVIKPNRTWLERVTGQTVDSVDAAIAAIQECRAHQQWAGETLLVTLDRDGMVLSEPDQPCLHLPAKVRQVYDVSGAGDMVQAVLGACTIRGEPMRVAAEQAIVAAGLEVEQFGVVPVSWAEIQAAQATSSPIASKLMTHEVAAERIAAAQQRGETVVLTNGCFDLLHAGHVRLLQQAAALGDRLVVAINSDDSVRRLKGETRPFISQDQRAEMLAALECVSLVVMFDEDTPAELLQQLRPDVLVKGSEYAVEKIVGGEFVTSYGGRVVTVPMVPGLSTTQVARECGRRVSALAPGPDE